LRKARADLCRLADLPDAAGLKLVAEHVEGQPELFQLVGELHRAHVLDRFDVRLRFIGWRRAELTRAWARPEFREDM